MRIERLSGYRRGMALMVVVGTISVASLMALAMLSSSSLQARMGGTMRQVAQADYLAESGVNYAIHQLCKTAASDEIYAGGAHSFGGEGRERFVVTVARQPESATDYDIVSRGEVLDAAGHVVASKTAQATVRVQTELKYNHSAVFGADKLVFDSGGMVELESVAAKRITIADGHTINNLTAQFADGNLMNVAEVNQGVTFPYRVTPVSAVRTFDNAPYLYSDGKVYWADPLPSGSLTATTLGPTTSNPAGVYYRRGNVTLNGHVTIRGSLIVLDGNLTINGMQNLIDGSQDHSRGFPTLVVRDGDIRPPVMGAGRILEVNGPTWVGGTLGASNLGMGTEMLFRGVVILPLRRIEMRKPPIPALGGVIRIEYNPANNDVARLDRELISDVQILSWSNR